ncbi:hypothetical protein GGX14DRAFT_390823 [Mycena pura]|uniref:Uncharacterized protein n=1 Tax=Mycena pura TaxID=153505 RepID=A0AAD6YFE8_9AGAR|nr:hypothetical protein GGX14DRAFT_390823 [Mycena pura]
MSLCRITNCVQHSGGSDRRALVVWGIPRWQRAELVQAEANAEAHSGQHQERPMVGEKSRSWDVRRAAKHGWTVSSLECTAFKRDRLAVVKDDRRRSGGQPQCEIPDRFVRVVHDVSWMRSGGSGRRKRPRARLRERVQVAAWGGGIATWLHKQQRQWPSKPNPRTLSQALKKYGHVTTAAAYLEEFAQSGEQLGLPSVNHTAGRARPRQADVPSQNHLRILWLLPASVDRPCTVPLVAKRGEGSEVAGIGERPSTAQQVVETPLPFTSMYSRHDTGHRRASEVDHLCSYPRCVRRRSRRDLPDVCTRNANTFCKPGMRSAGVAGDKVKDVRRGRRWSEVSNARGGEHVAVAIERTAVDVEVDSGLQQAADIIVMHHTRSSRALDRPGGYRLQCTVLVATNISVVGVERRTQMPVVASADDGHSDPQSRGRATPKSEKCPACMMRTRPERELVMLSPDGRARHIVGANVGITDVGSVHTLPNWDNNGRDAT